MSVILLLFPLKTPLVFLIPCLPTETLYLNAMEAEGDSDGDDSQCRLSFREKITLLKEERKNTALKCMIVEIRAS